MNSAQPVAAPSFAGHKSNPPAANQPVIIVLDTGWNERVNPGEVSVDELIAGQPCDADVADDGTVAYRELGAQAGHGTFIVELLCRLAPEATLVPHRVLNCDGLCDEPDLIDAIEHVVEYAKRHNPTPVILSLSLSSYFEDDEITPLLEAALAALDAQNVVVVAAAGNDGSCRPAFPAAAPGVVGVGAVGRGEIPGWTNWGKWVRACAPGVDIVSRFFTGQFAVDDDMGIERKTRYNGWAQWSGTSFAAPFVAAVLARIVKRTGAADARAAVAAIIDDESLATIPGLGTVVNGG